MQFVADEDTLQGLVFWTRAAWLAHHGRNWRCWRRRWRCFTLVAASCLAAYRATPRRRRAMSFGIDVRRLRLGSLLRTACWRPFRLRLWGQLALLAWCTAYFPPVAGRRSSLLFARNILIGGLVLSLASVASKNIIPVSFYR